MTARALPTPFSPSDSALPRLLDAIANPALSLREIALAHNTTTDSLALWMARPEIADQLAATDSITAWRTRLIAKSLLTKVVATCAQALEDLRRDAPAAPTPSRPTSSSPPSFSSLSPSPSSSSSSSSSSSGPNPAPNPNPNPPSPSPSPDPLRLSILKIRSAESTRRLCSLIFQLSRIGDTPRPHLPRPSAGGSNRTEAEKSARTPTPPHAPDPAPLLPRPGGRGAERSEGGGGVFAPTPSPSPTLRSPPPPTTKSPTRPAPTLPLPLPPLTSIPSLLDPLPTFPSFSRSPTSLLAAAGASREHWP